MTDENHMNTEPPVKLKGVGGGLWITLDPSRPQDLIKNEVKTLFERLKHLAVNAEVVIDTGDAKGQEELIDEIKTYLVETFHVKTVKKPPEKRSVPVERIRQRDLSRSFNHHKSDVMMLRGRVRSGQKIESGKHIVIAGDVNPGAEISAGGDIIVLGRLKGKVHAGVPDNHGSIIFALEFNPTQVRIGNITAAGTGESSKKTAEFASIDHEGIVVREYLKANPFGKMPWPEVI